ncbi:O-antigen ligase family protein [Deinococcus sp. KSM4-11]|uniref:O-antigen ligase family protein n=1 Tax=Deinococcus sp. KSM4-11 TaxID=2568654 RepID=UPI0010A41935|nr:O-antigen ligase family protein [Deinococcus sp. KSM4-11]THF87262.1 O-antigen ligase family protein [Deinococcus sp. KSM4-11]
MTEVIDVTRLPYVLLLLSVGVTSSPLVPTGSSARPLSLYFAALSVLAFMMAGRRLRHTRTVLAVVAFLAFLLLRQLFALEYPDPAVAFTFKGQTVQQDLVSAALTVVVFGLHYFAFQTAFQVLGARRALWYALVGLSLSAALAVVQGVADILGFGQPINALTSVFSASAIDWVGRARGLAFEPSWLASQLTVLMVPILLFLLVAVRRSYGVFTLGRVRMPIEVALLGLAVLALLFTNSRGGLAALVGALGGLFLYFLRHIHYRMNLLRILLTIFLVGTVGYVSSGNAYVASALGSVSKLGNLQVAFSSANAGPRFAAWQGAVTTFLEHPWTGVGLGLQHRYFAAHPPQWALNQPEVQVWLSPLYADRANAKNLPLRLLSEAGVIGLTLFMVLFMTTWRHRDGRLLLLFMAVPLGIDFMSLDSLALITYPLILVLLLEVKRESQRHHH